MLRVTSEKTYKLAKQILAVKNFKQREIAKKLKISPARVNEVVQWLVEKNYVERYRGKYQVSSPLGIVNLFSYLRSMKELKTATIKLGIDRKKIMKYLKKEKVVLCGTTALQFYSGYFRDPSIHFYAKNFDKIKTELQSLPTGMLTINIYKPDMFLEQDTVKKEGMLITTKLRTVIDLFCGDFAYAAKLLIEELWGVKIG